MVTRGSRTADVGCDHGFVSIYLYENQIAPKVYAMDLRKGPLERAREHIAARGFSDYIETRLSDGLEALAEGEADTLICAGMGGRLMAEILSRGQEKTRRMKELILQPQSELRYFRAFLRENGYVVSAENMVKEDGKFYVIMKASYCGRETAGCFCKAEGVTGGECKGTVPVADGVLSEVRQRIADSFGVCLLKERHPVLKEYLEMLQDRNEKILAELGSGESQKQAGAVETAAGRRAEESGAVDGYGTAQKADGDGVKDGRREQRKKELLEELSDIERCLLLYTGDGEAW